MRLLPRFLTRATSKPFSNVGLTSSFWGNSVSVSGESVNNDSAMRIMAVYACCRLVAETVATLPCVLYREIGSNKEPVKNHPVYRVLKNAPNPYQTSVEFWDTLMWHCLMTGNAYARLYYDNLANVSEMYIYPPNSVQAKVENGDLYYEVTESLGSKVPVNHNDMLHIRGPSWDGILGLSPVDLARESLGNAIAQERYSSETWKNGAMIGGILTSQGKLSDQAIDNLRKSWRDQSAGTSNARGTAILHSGVEFKPISMTNDQAQLLEEKKYSRAQIAAMFRVPPHMIGDLDRATFSNIEQQSLEFYQFTIRPWLVRIEAAIKNKVFSRRESASLKAEFNADALLRGDFLTRQQGLAIQRQNGIINIDEWRALENKNPLPDGKGEQHLVPMNMEEAGTQPQEKPSTIPGGVPNSPGSVVAEPDMVPRFAIVAELRRILIKEQKAIIDGKKNKDEYSEKVRAQIEERMIPYLLSSCVTDPAAIVEEYAIGYAERCRTGVTGEGRLAEETKAFLGLIK